MSITINKKDLKNLGTVEQEKQLLEKLRRSALSFSFNFNDCATNKYNAYYKLKGKLQIQEVRYQLAFNKQFSKNKKSK